MDLEQAIIEYIKKFNGEWLSSDYIVKNITPAIFKRNITIKYVGIVAKMNEDVIEKRAKAMSLEKYGYLAVFRYKTEVSV